MNRLLITFLLIILIFNPVFSQTIINQREKDGEKYLYLNFVVNAHDFTEPAQACKTLMRAAHTFNNHGVKADFYFVEQLITNIVRFYPWFPDSLKTLGMGINLHHRAPHILSFKSSYINNLAKKPLDTLVYVLDSYEKYRLDLVTGGYNSSFTGGYKYVKEVFNQSPFTVSTGESGPTSTMGRADIIACKSMGASGLLLFHEEGSDPDYPLFYSQGMLLRPVDFSITRWTAGSQPDDEFWWEMIGTPDETEYSPARYLASKMNSINNNQLNFANAIIHETDFHYNLPPWRACYYSDSMSTVPLQAPFDTSRTNFWIRTNSELQEERLWSYYDSLVAYAASNPNIRTYIMNDLKSIISLDLERSVSINQVYNIANTITSSNPNNFPPRFFTIGGDHFSIADAYYTITKSLSEYLATGSLPGSVTTVDINGPFDTTVVNLSSLLPIDSLSVQKAVEFNDSLFTYYASNNKFLSRIPSSVITAGFPSANPLEYLFIAASALKNIYETGGIGSIIPKSISYTNKPIFQNPSKWSEKPARRISVTSVEDENPSIPDVFQVSQNFPNPFNPSTSFKINLSGAGVCDVQIYDISGKQIHSELIATDGSELVYNFNGEDIASGVYLFKFSFNNNVILKKAILIK